MDHSMEKYDVSPMFQSSTLSSQPTTSSSTLNTFENNEYSASVCENSPNNATTKTMTIVDGRFFRMIPEKCIMNTTVATCVKCEPRYIEIKGNVNSSSNFLCHLKRKHGIEAVQEYTEYLHTKKRCRRGPPPNAMEFVRQSKFKAMQLQEQLEQNILKFIINSMLPMETVTNSYFLEIFRSFNVPELELKVFNSDILNGKLVDLFHRTSDQLKQDIRAASEIYFVVTIWKSKEEATLVAMAYWIDEEMMRRSAVLKIRRISQIQSRYDWMDHILKEIQKEFNLEHTKLNSIRTGTCNILQAMRTYGIDKTSIVDRQDDMQEEIYMKNDILSSFECNFSTCNVQILRNFASFDVIEVISNSETLSVLHRRVMQKCNILWSHPELDCLIEEIAGITLSKPTATSWVSVYTALEELLSIKDKSIDIFQAFDMKNHLNDLDFLYIEEHLACTKPIVDALTILEDSKHSLFGSLLPTLLALRRHLNKLLNRQWKCCGSLINSLVNMVNEKFHIYFNFESSYAVDAAIAAFSHPEFKNRWLSCVDVDLQPRLLQSFKTAVEAELPRNSSLDTKEGILYPQSRMEFFDFGSENEVAEPMSSKAIVDMQILNYFNYSSRNLDCLKHFPEINKVFIAYNTPLSSFAIVEKILEYDILRQVTMPGNGLDKYLDMKVWLKANRNLF